MDENKDECIESKNLFIDKLASTYLEFKSELK